MTLLNQFSDDNTKLLCSNGGENNEGFSLRGEFNHTKPASTLVSSSRGLGATTGEIQVENNGKNINLQWDLERSAVMPMLQSSVSGNKKLSRILFSLQEVDDTAKDLINIGSFDLLISSKKI